MAVSHGVYAVPLKLEPSSCKLFGYNAAMATPSKQKTIPPKKPRPAAKGPSMWMQFMTAIIIFFLLSVGYSSIRQYITEQKEAVPLSQIAADIQTDKISSIVVEGNIIRATYKDATEKTSRKESETSFTETLANYDIAKEKIDAVKIDIKDEGGARYWFLTLAPLLLPWKV